MDNKFKICYKDDFDYSNIEGDPGATIYVLINGGYAFPDNEWFDLPLSVMDMWGWNITENYKLKNAEFTLCFMDGPFYIKCQRNGDELKMQCINNRKDDELIESECIYSFKALTCQIYEVASELLECFNSKGLSGHEMLKRFKKKVKKVGKIKNKL